jgi:hypothetical protein
MKKSSTATPSPALSPAQSFSTVLQEPPVREAASEVDFDDEDSTGVELTVVESKVVGLATAVLSANQTVEVGRVELRGSTTFCVMLNGTVAKSFKNAASSVSLYKIKWNPSSSGKVVVTVQL